MKYEFWPYTVESGVFMPNGAMQSGEADKTANNQFSTCYLQHSNIGFYKVYLQTLDEGGTMLRSATKPFDIWVYPKE